MSEKLTFIGAGRWASALAAVLARRFEMVVLHDTDPSALRRVRARRAHPDLPRSARLPANVTAEPQAAEALAGAGWVVFALPARSVAASAAGLARLVPPRAAVVTVTKGFEPRSGRRLSVVIEEALGRRAAVLAGPGIPYDFAAGDPTTLVAASANPRLADRVRDAFSIATLRVYSQPDVIGVEVGAALKNVIAMAAGISDGLGLGINAKSALTARGLAEMIRLGRALGARPTTFAGLSGLGDLVVTAFSPHSRNYGFGLSVGRGVSAEQASAALSGVAEGVGTSATARRIARRLGVELPITEEVFHIVHRGRAPDAAMRRLLARAPKREVWT